MPTAASKTTTTRKSTAKKTTTPAQSKPDASTPSADKPQRKERAKVSEQTIKSLHASITLMDAEPVKGTREGGAGRVKEFNPWVDTIVDLLDANAMHLRTTKGFTVPYGSKDERDAADKLTRQLGLAGVDAKVKELPPVNDTDGKEVSLENGCTVRMSRQYIDGDGEGSKEVTEDTVSMAVKFWVRPKISKPRGS